MNAALRNFVLAAVVVLAACRSMVEQGAAPIQDAATERLQLGRQVYERECATCHGMRGEGQPNWQVPLDDGSLPAPPQDSTGHSWHHPDALLAQIIQKGGTLFSPTSTMPGYEGVLSEPEVAAVIAYIKLWWGPDELAFQAEQNATWDRASIPPSPAP